MQNVFFYSRFPFLLVAIKTCDCLKRSFCCPRSLPLLHSHSSCASTIADTAPTLPSNSTTAPAFNLQQQHPFQAVAAAIAFCHCSCRSRRFPLPHWLLPPQSPFAAAAAVALSAVPPRLQQLHSCFFCSCHSVCCCRFLLQLLFAIAVAVCNRIRRSRCSHRSHHPSLAAAAVYTSIAGCCRSSQRILP